MQLTPPDPAWSPPGGTVAAAVRLSRVSSQPEVSVYQCTGLQEDVRTL